MTRRLLLLGHLLGAVLFYGNLILAWALYLRGRRVREPAVLAHLYALMNLADRWLTPVSVVLLLGTGLAAARLLALPLVGTPWIIWSLVAFGASGLVFLGRLLGLQRSLEHAAAAGAAGQPFDPAAFRALTRRWAVWAALGCSLAAVPLVLMVLRVGSGG